MAAVEALVRFGTVILYMTLERASIKVIVVFANRECSHTSFLHFLHTSGSGQSELLWPSWRQLKHLRGLSSAPSSLILFLMPIDEVCRTKQAEPILKRILEFTEAGETILTKMMG